MSYTTDTARHLVEHGGSCRDIYCEKVIDKNTVEKRVCFTYCCTHDGGTEYACYKKAREYLKEDRTMKRDGGIWWLKVCGEWVCVGSMHDAFEWKRDIEKWVR